MPVLITLAHPMRDSFTANVADELVSGLYGAGHTSEVADLYGEGFSPALTAADLGQFEGIPMADDVLKEQERFLRCDGFALVFPIWWWSFPARLKGWIDRVFSAGFAYHLTDDPEGSMLAGRKALMLGCASRRAFEARGTDTAVQIQLCSGVMEYCGASESYFEIFHKSRVATEIDDEASTRRQNYLKKAKHLGLTYFSESTVTAS